MQIELYFLGVYVNQTFIDIPKNSDFSFQNLPYGVFNTKDRAAHVGVAIGSKILDLSVLESKKLVETPTELFQYG